MVVDIGQIKMLVYKICVLRVLQRRFIVRDIGRRMLSKGAVEEYISPVVR